MFIPYYFDAGAGGSNLNWQIASGLGYQTGWVGASLTYRYLSFQQGNSAVLQHLSVKGPMLMANFTFWSGNGSTTHCGLAGRSP